MKYYSLVIAALLLATPAALFAADSDTPPATSLPAIMLEAPSPFLNTPNSPGTVLLGSDVVVSSLSGNQSEVIIDVNPTNSQNLVVVGHAAGGFGTMDTFFSTDGGATWTRVALGNAQDGFTSTFRFDPAVAFDANGNVYVAYGVRDFAGTTRRESVVVCRSTNGGQSYAQFRTIATTNSIGTLPGNDKWLLATGRDPINANQQNVYIAWTQNVTEGASTDQRIVVSRSTDGGNAWNAPVIIADDANAGADRGLTADPAVGPNGEVYVSWHDFGDQQLLIDRSTDGGLTWGTDNLIASPAFAGLNISIPPQPDRNVSPQGCLDVDRSGGPNNGRLYFVYMDGTSPNTNIFCRTSNNGGVNWSAAVQVNDDATTRSQFLPWCDLDDTSGNLSVIFYDARDDANNQKVHVYHALSTTGGASFGANTKVTDNPSDQSTANASRTTNNYLDYIGVAATSCVAYAVWSDNSGNLADLDYHFDFIPLESTAPNISCPSPITVECSETGGASASNPAIAAFLNGATASDNCDDTPTITNDAPSFFPDGTTTVTFTARDDAGNTATCTADVTIEDTTAPAITYCPVDTVVECSSHCGVAKADLAAWLGGFAATDICDASPTLGNDAPDCFPDGATTVTFTATDDAGNPSTCTAKLTVEDTTPPVIDVILDRDVLWPPNHKLVEVCAEVTVTDICDPNPTFVLLGIVSDEPDNDKGDGNTFDDIQNEETGTPDLCFDLRSERQGIANGRKYTIYYRASDESGNTADDTVCVRVPHDHSSSAFASSGFRIDGTSLQEGADRFVVIIPTTDAVEATSLEHNVYLGNTRGVTRPLEQHMVDLNHDQRADLALVFDAGATSLLAAPGVMSITDGNGALAKTEGDGPLGIHFVNHDGTDYLIGNIFALGTRVQLPPVWADDLPGVLQTTDGKPVVRPGETALSSIHPNPFNPMTTVEFSLSSSGRVRIAVYDVRGTLVKRLVDENMPAGDHRATWDGHDNTGRPASSGIYFVRMMAGAYQQTRKIVMLK
jgi:hypothetical protein